MDVFKGCLPALEMLQAGSLSTASTKEEDEDQDMPNRGKRSRQDPEQNKPTPKGGKGKGGRKDNDNRGTWNHWERNSWDSSTWRPQRRPELDQLVEALCRLSLKQEEELQLLRTEKQFLLHMESGPQGLLHPLWKVAQAWKVGKDKTPPTVTSSLRVALIKCMLAEWAARLDLMTKNEETLKKMEAQGWVKISGRERADVELPAVECSESSAGTGSKPGTHQPQHGGQDSGGPSGTGYVRSRAAHPSFSFDTQADGNHCGGHTPLHPVSGNEGLQRTAGARCLQPPGGKRGLSVGGDQATGRKDALAAPGAAHCQNGSRPPPLKAADIFTTAFPLHDRHGYMVACMLAWLMAGADHHDVDFIAGSLTHAVKSFLTVGSSFRLASSLPWRPFLQGWDMSNSDVMKWLMHILPQAAAPVLQGTWEARVHCESGYECTAAGNTWTPICLQDDSMGDTCDLDLNALFSEWRVQGDRCALVQAPQVLCVTSPRWLNSAAGEQRVISQGKVQTVVHVSILWMLQHTTSLTTLFRLSCTMPMMIISVLATGQASERLDGIHMPMVKLPNKSN